MNRFDHALTSVSRPRGDEGRTLLAVVLFGLAGSACAVALVAAGFTLGNVWAVLGLGLVGIAGERGRVKVGDYSEISISLLPALFAAVLFGPLAAMLVYGVSMIGKPEAPILARAYFGSTRALTGALTGIVAAATVELGSNEVAGIAIAAGVAGVVAECVDVGFTSVAYGLRGHGRMRDAISDFGPLAFASVPFYMPVVALLAFAYRDISPLTLPLFFAPALAAQRWFFLYQDQRRLANDLVNANARLERANLSFAGALVATLDARDRYTAGHSAAVAIYASDIAARMGLSPEEQRLAHLAGLVHDIGKIGLPAGLLEKSGALTLDERRLMERHPEIGERIIAKVDTYSEIASIVRHHHERVDGQGYPDGLPDSEIPLLARVIAVADAYNAMTSDRPYRDAMPSRVARLRLAQAVDSQFDITVVAAFEAILAAASESYRLGKHPEFRFDLPEWEKTQSASEMMAPLGDRVRTLAQASS